ncbi:phage tail protein I [Exiguobacterium chiriqhucha]|uniref:phage tail protein I n=1 Tax=Exiguobacterium chiriqhucha TaxID=1385984 RepID=UPI0023F0C3C3|nr:phage tail protein I [Exiguobacterium chiriqhucha]
MIDLKNYSLNDLLPEAFRNNLENAALADAIGAMFSHVLTQSESLDPMRPLPEFLLDLIAKEEHVDYYDDKLEADKKRSLIRNSWKVHRNKGTAEAVESVVSVLLESAKVVEWFEYGGDPYHFKIEIDGSYSGDDVLEVVFRAVNASKRRSTRLEAIWFRGDGFYYRVLDGEDGIVTQPVIREFFSIADHVKIQVGSYRTVSEWSVGLAVWRKENEVFA